MEDVKIDNRKLNLLKRTIILLEATKVNYKKYEEERKKLLNFTKSKSVDYKQWENYLLFIECKIKAENNI